MSLFISCAGYSHVISLTTEAVYDALRSGMTFLLSLELWRVVSYGFMHSILGDSGKYMAVLGNCFILGWAIY